MTKFQSKQLYQFRMGGYVKTSLTNLINLGSLKIENHFHQKIVLY